MCRSFSVRAMSPTLALATCAVPGLVEPMWVSKAVRCSSQSSACGPGPALPPPLPPRQATVEVGGWAGTPGPSCALPCIGTPVSSPHKTPSVLPPLPWMMELPPNSFLLLPYRCVYFRTVARAILLKQKPDDAVPRLKPIPSCLPS